MTENNTQGGIVNFEEQNYKSDQKEITNSIKIVDEKDGEKECESQLPEETSQIEDKTDKKLSFKE